MQAIRDEQERLIKALTPTSRASERFKLFPGEDDFFSWLETNPQAATRVFEITNPNDGVDPLVSNTDIVDQEQSEDVAIAYPLDFGLYGFDNMRALEDLIAEDKWLIDQEIGLHGYTNYLAGQHLTTLESSQVIRFDQVAILALSYRVIFRRQAS